MGHNTADVSLLQLFTRRTGALLLWQRERGILRSVKDEKHGGSIFGKSPFRSYAMPAFTVSIGRAKVREFVGKVRNPNLR